MLALILSVAFAGCPTLYAKKDSDGYWMVSNIQEVGALEITQSANCNYDPSLFTTSNGKLITEKANVTAKGKIVDNMKDFKARIEKLEADVAALKAAP